MNCKDFKFGDKLTIRDYRGRVRTATVIGNRREIELSWDDGGMGCLAIGDTILDRQRG